MRKIGIALLGLLALATPVRADNVGILCDKFFPRIDVDTRLERASVSDRKVEFVDVQPTYIHIFWYENERSISAAVIINRSTLEVMYSSSLVSTKQNFDRFDTPCKRIDGKRGV